VREKFLSTLSCIFALFNRIKIFSYPALARERKNSEINLLKFKQAEYEMNFSDKIKKSFCNHPMEGM
jgi:hypothetical protein